jgi:hypothetical protein
MKLTDLEKNRGLKINNRLKQGGAPGRYGADAAEAPDRKAQRKRDQELGLVPFAVKLPAGLAVRLREQATARGVDLNGLVAEVLEKGLAR